MQYFEALGLEPSLDLDLADLEKRFYARSRELHPDRFARSSREDQARTLDLSSVLNDAYRTLKDPVARAEYLLRQHGVDSKTVPPDLLEEVFELNMALEEGDEPAKARLREMLAEVDARLTRQFAAWDASRDAAGLAAIRESLNRRKYIGNLVHEHLSD